MANASTCDVSMKSELSQVVVDKKGSALSESTVTNPGAFRALIESKLTTAEKAYLYQKCLQGYAEAFYALVTFEACIQVPQICVPSYATIREQFDNCSIPDATEDASGAMTVSAALATAMIMLHSPS